ncbi:uncharacterized protein TRIADDRAFT_62781 [Trichoplax adhaerens]|uniref:TCTP domain-containing protein n=1 Tax=Trichoplax adhaerens TaxID=10228 RepID=B3SEV1_TRIAD|nr:predicted protein [Trichoplax adhaerens]EDV18744.1 predicted protein [Trichoplax adhaerens]|eukprot:XP_002118770.1 predicted protein [Trichoplax adhaerens]
MVYDPHSVETFKEKTAEKTQEIVVTFSDWQFFMRESMNTKAMHVLVKYDGDKQISLLIPLSSIFGFCKDVDTVFRGVKHTLQLDRAATANYILKDSNIDDGKFKISHVSMWMPKVTPSLEVASQLEAKLMDSVQLIDYDRIKESFFVFQNMNYLGTDDTDHMVKIVNEAIHGYAKYWIDLYVRCLKHNDNVYVSLMNSEVMRKLETAFPEINTDDIPKIPRISFLNVPIKKTKRKRTSSGSQESEIIKELHEKWQPATHGLIRTLSDLSVQPKTLDDCKTRIDECEQRMQTNDSSHSAVIFKMDDETALQVLFKKENDDEQMEMDSVQSIDYDRIKESFFVFQNMNYLGTDDTDHMVKIVNEAIHGYAKYWIDLYVRCLKHNNNVYVSLMNNDSEVMRKLETAFPEINTDDIPKIPEYHFLMCLLKRLNEKELAVEVRNQKLLRSYMRSGNQQLMV